MKTFHVGTRVIKTNPNSLGGKVSVFSRDRGEPVLVSITEDLLEEKTFQAFCENNGSRMINVLSDRGYMGVLSINVPIDKAGPYAQLCSVVGNMFYSSTIHDIATSDQDYKVDWKWYVNIQAYPMIKDMQLAGIKSYTVAEHLRDSIRVMFVLPINQSNDTLTTCEGFSTKLISTGCVNVLPISLLTKRTFTMSSSNISKYFVRKDRAFNLVFHMYCIIGDAVITPDLVFNTKTYRNVTPVVSQTFARKTRDDKIVIWDQNKLVRAAPVRENNPNEVCILEDEPTTKVSAKASVDETVDHVDEEFYPV
jgi:hypothetical protein